MGQLTQRNWITTTTVQVSGNTTLVLAPGTGVSLIIHGYSIVSATETLNPISVGFAEEISGYGHYQSILNTRGAQVVGEFVIPWAFGTASAIYFSLTQTGAFISTPSIIVTVRGSSVIRG